MSDSILETKTPEPLYSTVKARSKSRRTPSRRSPIRNFVANIWQGVVNRREHAKTDPAKGRKKVLQFAAISASIDPMSTGRANLNTPSGNSKIMVASAAEKTDSSTSYHLLGNMLAGGVAGCGVESVLFPLDTIKTRLQAGSSMGAMQWTGLYKGLYGNMMGAFPASAVFFGVYEPVKNALERKMPDYTFLAHFGAAATANLAASIVRVPSEVVKQRLQTNQFNSAFQAFSSIARKEGPRGLYAGYGAFMLRDLPFDIVEFVAYEQMKTAYTRGQGRDLNPTEVAVIGGGAGVLTGVLTTPFDVIKTKLMVQGTTKQYSGVVDCAVKLVKAEGPRALFSGVGARVTWIGLGGCIFFSTLEAAKKVFVPQESEGMEAVENKTKKK